MPFVTRKSLFGIAVLLIAAVVMYLGFIWSGLYNVGADDPHWKPTMWTMQTLRARSIQVRSRDLKVPDLDNPELILKGAGQYAAMCTGCHLAPGLSDSELRPGLYPQPPNLSLERFDPKNEFWVIKHGVKMSAMPAWGLTHDDPTIWSMVAFLQKLPTLTPAQYQEIVAKAPPDEDMDGGGHHHGDPGADHGTAMPGMPMAGPAAVDTTHRHGETDDHHHDEAAQPNAALSMDGLQPGAEPAAEAAANAFHTALQKGDRAAALALLAPEARIIEGSETQTLDQYAAGHLSEDIAFLKSALIKPLSLGSMPMGQTAMVGSSSDIRTTHDGKPLALHSTEMLTLKKTPTGWLITRIEWASQRLSK